MQVIITRAEAEARTTADHLSALGFTPVVAPLAEMVCLPFTLPDQPFEAVLATSRNALACLGPEQRSRLCATKLFCVGKTSAERAKELGFTAVVWAADVGQLAETVEAGLKTGQAALYLAGEPRKPDLEQALANTVELTTLTVYRMVEAETFPAGALAQISDPHPVWLHYSQQSARRAAALAGRSARPGLFAQSRHLVLSEAIHDTVAALGGTDITTAAHPDQSAMMESLLTIRQASAG